jgi:hypothetical protein
MAEPATERVCPKCSHVLDRKGICWPCYDQEAQNKNETLKLYRDGSWLVDLLVREGNSEDEAAEFVECRYDVLAWIEMFEHEGLVEVLADHSATETLRQSIIAKDRRTLKALSDCLRGEQGPSPKKRGHLEQQVLRLKRAGKTNNQIAKDLGINKNSVAAAYNNITKKIARRQAWMRQ